jgi:hypothetical protein
MDTVTQKRAVMVALCLAMMSFGAGCSGHGSSEATGDTSPAVGVTPSTSPTGTPGRHKTKKQHPTTRASDYPLAPTSYQPVVRDGKTPHPSISAAPATFTQPVRYSDGVRLVVTAIHEGEVSGQGPGVISGPMTTFDLRFVNGSDRAISLDSVVPTVEFGTPARIARPVYDDQTQDFGTTVKPGGRTTATYAFSIPVGQLSDVTVHLDFDGRHYASTFHGSVAR